MVWDVSVGLRPCTNTISIDALSTLGPSKTLMFAMPKNDVSVN